MKDKLLRVNHICKKYKSQKGIFDISFEVQKGMILGIIGANGSGKSTLISCLSGITQVDSGQIEYLIDNNIFKADDRKLLNKLGIVRCEQGYPEDFTSKSVAQILRRVFADWDQDKYEKNLELLQIDNAIMIKNYSAGMKSKLSIAIALAHNSKILLLDEATNGMDIITCNLIKKLFFEFVEDGKHSVIFASHKIGEIERIADQIIILHEGKILLNCSKDDLLQDYAVQQMSLKKFERVDKRDILKIYKVEFFVNILPQNARVFRDKYSVDNEFSELESIVQIMLGGETIIWQD